MMDDLAHLTWTAQPCKIPCCQANTQRRTELANNNNKAIVKRLYEELNRENMSIDDELIVDDYAQHSILPEPQGRKGFKEFFTAFRTAFPNAHFEV